MRIMRSFEAVVDAILLSKGVGINSCGVYLMVMLWKGDFSDKC